MLDAFSFSMFEGGLRQCVSQNFQSLILRDRYRERVDSSVAQLPLPIAGGKVPLSL